MEHLLIGLIICIIVIYCIKGASKWKEKDGYMQCIKVKNYLLWEQEKKYVNKWILNYKHGDITEQMHIKKELKIEKQVIIEQ